MAELPVQTGLMQEQRTSQSEEVAHLSLQSKCLLFPIAVLDNGRYLVVELPLFYLIETIHFVWVPFLSFLTLQPVFLHIVVVLLLIFLLDLCFALFFKEQDKASKGEQVDTL